MNVLKFKILSQVLERKSYWISAMLCFIDDVAFIQSLKIIDIVDEDNRDIEIVVEEKSPIRYFLN